MTEDVSRANLRVTKTEFREGRKQHLLARVGQISRRRQPLSWMLKGRRDLAWQRSEERAF